MDESRVTPKTQTPLPEPFWLFVAFACLFAAGCFLEAVQLFRLPVPEPDLFSPRELWPSAWHFQFGQVGPGRYLAAAILAAAGLFALTVTAMLVRQRPRALAFIRAFCIATACAGLLYLILAPYYPALLTAPAAAGTARQGTAAVAVFFVIWHQYFTTSGDAARFFPSGADNRGLPVPPLSVGLLQAFCALMLAGYGLALWDGLAEGVRARTAETLLPPLCHALPPCLFAAGALLLLRPRCAARPELFFVLGCWLLFSCVLPPVFALAFYNTSAAWQSVTPVTITNLWLALLWWHLAANGDNSDWFNPWEPPGKGARTPLACGASLVEGFRQLLRSRAIPGLAVLGLALMGYYILNGVVLWISQLIFLAGAPSPPATHPFFTTALNKLCLFLPLLWVYAVVSFLRAKATAPKLSRALACLCPLLSVFTVGAQSPAGTPYTELAGPLLLGLIFQPAGGLVVFGACVVYFGRLVRQRRVEAGVAFRPDDGVRRRKPPLPVVFFQLYCLIRLLDFGAAAILYAINYLFREFDVFTGQTWLSVGLGVFTWTVCPLLACWAARKGEYAPADARDGTLLQRTRRALWFWIACLCALAFSRGFISLEYFGTAAFWNTLWQNVNHTLPLLLGALCYMRRSKELRQWADAP